MNFLSPWFLLGALAVAGPILFHLIRRVVRERMPFSSLMFLSPSPPRVTRRRKLDNLWLLLLRCLCLLLLATGFARPFFSSDTTLPAPAGESRQIILLMDTSASMRREGVWEKARTIAASYLKKISPADEVAVVTFDRQPHTLVSFTEWSAWSADQRAALAQQRLTATAPGWMGTQLGLALTSAAEQFVDDSATAKPAAHRELVLISDLQEGAKLDGLQGHDWPTGVKTIIERVAAKPQANAGLEILSEANATVGDASPLRVRVTNARDSSREKFSLAWDFQNSIAPAEIYLPPGQTRTFAAPKFPAGFSAGKLQLTGDEADFDNPSYYVRPEVERVKIAWFGLESANDPEKLRYYVQRVFTGTPRRQIEIAPPTLHSAFSADLLNQSSFAFIPSQLTSEEILATHDWLARGKTALLILNDAQMKATLAALTGCNEVQVTEATGDFALLGQIDFTHPLFAPFADPRFSDFSHIHFWKHWRVEFPATVQVRELAKFDDGAPALTQVAVGQGNLLVLASGWNPADSQLAVSSKFPPLIQTLLDWSISAGTARFQFSTGDAIPAPAVAGEVRWQKPDGKTETLAATKPYTETDLPGIYVATFGGKERRFAVNLPLDESRTAPMSPDELARLGVPLQTPTEKLTTALTPERQRHLQQAELENRQKLWRWLIVGVLVVTFAEILLSGWLVRRMKTAEASA